MQAPKISLVSKFNFIILVIFVVCFLATGLIADHLLQNEAREEALANARLLLDSSAAASAYTVEQIVPLLENQLKYTFLPQSIPYYAATENLNALRRTHADYSYKEAMLNPMNPRDRATEWEEEVIVQLRDHPTAATEFVGEHPTATGQSLYIARPIVVNDKACLKCHSNPSEAPKTLLAAYGPDNGFNWKANEVLGAQIVSIPLSMPQARAHKILLNFMLWILLVFVLVFIALDVMVRLLVTRRLIALSRSADEVSMGKLDGLPIDTHGQDELSGLAQSFERMRSSLAKALRMLEK
jgi:HAMP domain-containing protein